jgi:hypothetical protein
MEILIYFELFNLWTTPIFQIIIRDYIKVKKLFKKTLNF